LYTTQLYGSALTHKKTPLREFFVKTNSGLSYGQELPVPRAVVPVLEAPVESTQM
jgi:hypothetical protein